MRSDKVAQAGFRYGVRLLAVGQERRVDEECARESGQSPPSRSSTGVVAVERRVTRRVPRSCRMASWASETELPIRAATGTPMACNRGADQNPSTRIRQLLAGPSEKGTGVRTWKGWRF